MKELETKYFSHGQGSGYIEASKEAVEVRAEARKLGGEVIAPNTMTTLQGHFCRELEYLGVRDKNEMIFYIGSDENLYDAKHYFQSVLWVSETRIYEHFKPQSGRDYNFVGGVWK